MKSIENPKEEGVEGSYQGIYEERYEADFTVDIKKLTTLFRCYTIKI